MKQQRSLWNDFKDRTILLGLFDFTRFGYRLRARKWRPLDVSLAGRTVVVTGATSGLGKAAATRLAALGARVVLVGRDSAKLEQTHAELSEQGDGKNIACFCADLGLMSEVRRLARELAKAEPALHVLVNNAGALFNGRGATAEGLERTFALNLLCPFLLTNLLLPKLQECVPARVVNVSSGGMYTQRIRVDDLQFQKGRYNGAVAYARAKRGLVILTEMWAEKLRRTGVTVNAMHPGWAETPGVISSLPGFYKVTRRVLRSPPEGADTMVWLAAAPEAAQETGLFWLDRQPRLTHVFPGTRESQEERKALWSELCRLSGWHEGAAA